MYAPEHDLYSIGATLEFGGLVQVTMLDYGSPDDTQNEPFDVVTAPPGAVGDVAECNVKGTAGKEDISADRMAPEARARCPPRRGPQSGHLGASSGQRQFRQVIKL